MESKINNAKNGTRMHLELDIVIRRSKDMPDQVWIGHCTTINVMSQGTSPVFAKKSITEVLKWTMLVDLSRRLNPMDRIKQI